MCELMMLLEGFMASMEPAMGYPPFIPPLLNVGCIGVGSLPVLLDESELNSEGLSMAGRMKMLDVPKAGDPAGWLGTSLSSSSMSISKSMPLDRECSTGPPTFAPGESATPPCSE